MVVSPKSVLLTGRSVRFVAIATGKSNITYKWEYSISRFCNEEEWETPIRWGKDEELLQSSRSSVLVLNYPTWKDIGAYRCIISSESGKKETIITPIAELMSVISPALPIPQDDDAWHKEYDWRILSSFKRSKDPTHITLAVVINRELYLYEFSTSTGKVFLI